MRRDRWRTSPSARSTLCVPTGVRGLFRRQLTIQYKNIDQIQKMRAAGLVVGEALAGWHGDAAVTVPVGRIAPAADRLRAAAEDALWTGITAAARGTRSGRGRLTDVSHAIETSIRGSGRYGIVDGYGGHGIGT